MTSRIRPASRSQAKPLIGIYSESGCGKTYSALLLARGFVGPHGRICMIETESGRGESYASPVEYPEIGGYDVLPLRENFSPETYGSAIADVERSGYDCLIVDSASAEWEGVGGVLDMAAVRESEGKKGMLVWQKPKIDHQKHFMLRFMQTPIPLVILNMRAKYPMIEVYNEKKGKKEPQRATYLEPKQSDDILYEMFVHGWISREDHAFHPTKITAKSLADVFVAGRPITLETGKALAEWAKGTQVKKEDNPLKKAAEDILRSIKNATSEIDLFSDREEFSEEWKMFEAIEGQKTYLFLQNEYDKKLATFNNNDGLT